MINKTLVLELHGEPYEMGVEHGRRARKLIQRNLSVYFNRFKEEAMLSRKEVIRRSREYMDVIERTDPTYAEAMEGISRGAKCEPLEIAALNVRYEIMYSEFNRMGSLKAQSKRVLPRPYGCTAFAAMPAATTQGHLLMGQNWDWIPGVQVLFIRIQNAGGLSILSFTEAGIVGGKIGLNSAGLGLAINGMVSNRDDWARLGKPFHVRCWEILNARTLDEAARIVTEEPRACSANFMLGQASGLRGASVLDLEAAPSGVSAIKPTDALLAHANHFANPSAVDVPESLEEERKQSIHRCGRMEQLLRQALANGSKLNAERLQAILRDHEAHPESVCRHSNLTIPKQMRYQTVVSVILDLHAQQLWVAAGPPCRHNYQLLSLK